ncbi:hypothetical protein [Bradyrhizobium sp. CIR3A]|uniref:hypothetical protein n=1 Tax=Bradyrhizobium sp. CIR3A TaxID=2663838 RepID=UPI0016062085|nr:hypothetical protein [Bradyrhizobium sp. CIR3A]MBB4262672.1 hypothetical protein [Bradyrhizobium sp. CIR3A]
MSSLEKKPIAWIIVLTSVVLFVRNMFEVDGPSNAPLGTVTLLGAIGGGIWLNEIYKEQRREAKRFREEVKRRDEEYKKRRQAGD